MILESITCQSYQLLYVPLEYLARFGLSGYCYGLVSLPMSVPLMLMGLKFEARPLF